MMYGQIRKYLQKTGCGMSGYIMKARAVAHLSGYWDLADSKG